MRIAVSRFLSGLLLAGALAASTVAVAHPLDNWYGRYTNSAILALRGVTFGNGLFVVVGSGGTILTSSNGEQWNLQSSGTALGLSRVSYGNGTFVIAGNSGCLLSSTNGTNWTLPHVPEFPPITTTSILEIIPSSPYQELWSASLPMVSPGTRKFGCLLSPIPRIRQWTLRRRKCATNKHWFNQ